MASTIIRKQIMFCLALCTTISFQLQSQNVEAIGSNIKTLRQQSLGLNGGINLGTNFYGSSNIDPRRDNLQWLANINLNLSFLGINAPFALTFSDGNQQFGLPSYAFTGISPEYKWAKLHLGDRNMFLSKYTMSGINFRGAGLELTPGKFRFKAMYGQLVRAVAEDLNSRQALDPAYKRTGWSMLGGYETKSFSVNAILFNARDDENSIADPLDFDITPSENVVASLIARKAFGNKFILDAELARSALNTDNRTNENAVEQSGFSKTFFGLFDPKETSNFGNAFNSGLTYNQGKYALRLGYERIDRGFKTLGAIFFNSDLTHYTGSITTRLLKNKLNLAARGGLEQTNKEDLTKPTNNRFVGSLNATYVPGTKFIYSASFSNFNNATKLRARENPAVFVDSLFLAQLTQTATFSTTYKIREKYNPTTLTGVFSHQSANSVQDDIVIQDARSRFSNVSLIFNQRITENNLTWTSSLNYNRSDFAALATNTWSPSLMINKGFFNNKLTSGLRLTYNAVGIVGGNNSTVMNIGLNSSYAIVKNQTIGLNLNFINRSGSGGDGLGDFSELFGRLQYNYQFDSSIGGSKQVKQANK